MAPSFPPDDTSTDLQSQIAHLSSGHPPSLDITAAALLATFSDNRPPTSQGDDEDGIEDIHGGGISLLDSSQSVFTAVPSTMSVPEPISDSNPEISLFSTSWPADMSMHDFLDQHPTAFEFLSMGSVPVPAFSTLASMPDELIGFETFAQGNLHELDVEPDHSNGENPNAQDKESFVDISTFVRQYVPRPKDVFLVGLDAVKQPETIIREDLRGDECDFQGINWSLLNIPRQSVRAKRAAFEITRLRSRLGNVRQQWPNETPNVDNFFSFRRMVSTHRAYISHFQLRNLLASTSKNDIFYSTRDQVMGTDPSGAPARCVMDLSKSKSEGRNILITTLAAAENFLIVGGFCGEYALTNLASEHGMPTTIGRAIHKTHIVPSPITNHIHMFNSRSNYTPQAVLCSNDNRLRILDCESNTFTHSFLYANPVNCSATSPNGRLRVVVGDFHETLITNAETGQAFETLNMHVDDVFACDWADDGIHVATAAQDHRIVIWDARNWSQPLNILNSELSTPRSLKFSPIGSGPRVLISAESDDYVNVINAQTFETRQVFDFFGKTAGISLSPDGSSLFVANSDPRFGGIIELERCGWGNTKEEKMWNGARNEYTPVDWMDDDTIDDNCDIVSTWQERNRRGVEIAGLMV
ncbi:YVTN repeat-like/Quino protein amine dehydrogenase [Lindgomyces ingoldianus]|uniref:YVTN repeat-like/Quino protein amine dehydrogenase n=1 Tax=Lindgomyces ingoldianus TaxID=673940 RepID=A0ACB6QP90_9PLEO|nr:YVTN repeat-like/Quino protein amine dehydrogenase [Lindgomyces ingoldianus]KAF2468102.1 YVTN repeat-like/Quino protein amine dehydrogenase [Lindgomyces ingoldianus]